MIHADSMYNNIHVSTIIYNIYVSRVLGKYTEIEFIQRTKIKKLKKKER